MSKVNWVDMEELARVVLGLDSDADSDAIEQAIYEKWGCGFEQFSEIVEALIDFTVPAQSALSGRVFKGFVQDGAFIVKVLVEESRESDNTPHSGE